VSERQPTILSIFAGIGGFDLAFNSAGFRTLAFVEWSEVKQIILREWFPDIPILGDIDTFDCDEFLRTFGRPDVIAGGVPCQAASLLGTRLGTADPRWKWPQAIRLARELRPRFCVFENPPALLTVGGGEAFNGIVSSMAALGYDCMWDVIPAAAFGAGHWRERLCIVFADALGVGKRITADQADAIAAGRDAWNESSGESDERAFSGDANNLNDDASGLGAGKISFEQATRIRENHSGAFYANANDTRSQGHAGNGAGGTGWTGQNRPTSAPSLQGTLSPDANRERQQGPRQVIGPSGSAADREREDNCVEPTSPRILPDLCGRVTGPDWWHEAQSGIPVLVSGLPGRLVEAASLCIGDSVVPQAWEPIARAIAEKLT
jgi:DNA-cytosine methyltransferase